jgi:RNA polymerase sigma-70 factor (ECF subfamily)
MAGPTARAAAISRARSGDVIAADLVVDAPGSTDDASAFDAVVERLLEGDEAAFTIVYRSVQPGLLRYLTVLVGPADAEDVASEAWAHACRDLARFRGDGDGFRGWVSTIARNRAMDHLRAQGRRPQAAASEEVLADRPAPDHTETLAFTSISTDAALALIRALPQDQAEAVLLRAVVGLDAKTAGAVLGKRAGAVRTAAYRGLRTLAALLDGAQAPADGVEPVGCDIFGPPHADGMS